MAQLILERALEIQPQNAQVQANVGAIEIYRRRFPEAKIWFERALKQDARNSLALWGMAGLYRHFHFSGKQAKFERMAKSSGKPTGITPPMVLGREEHL
jgi:Tfp pilus assembly protein PilF